MERSVIFSFLITYLFISIGSTGLYAQVIKFQKTYGGISSDHSQSIVQMADSGFTIAGSSYSFGNGDYDGYIVRTDRQGKISWSKTYGGELSEELNDLVITSDGGLVAGGHSNSYNGGGRNFAFYALKIDISGNLQWSKTFRNEYVQYIGQLLPATDGGFLCVGANDYTTELAKIDASGNFVFGKSYQLSNTSGITKASTGIALPSGDFIISGYFRNANDLYGIFIMKINDSGIPRWIKTYESIDGSSYIEDMKLLNDGSLLLAGRSDASSSAGLTDALLMKTDADGNLQWANIFGGGSYDDASGVSVACDGGFVITGRSRSFKNNLDDSYVLKTDQNGNIRWSKIYGGYSYDNGGKIITTSDCGMAITGSTQSFGAGHDDVYFLKLDANGTDSLKCHVAAATSIQKALHLTEGTQTCSPASWTNQTDIIPVDISSSTIQTDSICQQCSKPIADFDYVQNKMSINFLNYSLHGTKYSWLFGNGERDTLESPVYEYSHIGDYMVTLIASNECGTDTIKKNIKVINTSNCLFYIQPGPSRGKDASFHSLISNANANNVSRQILSADAWTWAGTFGVIRSSFQFDLSPVCSTDSLLGANLSLFSPTNNSYLYISNDNACTLYRNTSPWKDYTVTWNTKPAFTTINAVNVPPIAPPSNLEGLDVLQITKDMVNNGNHGFTLKQNTENTYRGTTFASSDWPAASIRPMLRLVFNPLTAYVNITDTIICPGETINLHASGGIKYKWYPSYGLSCTDCANPTASPDSSITYSVFVYSCESCAEVKKIEVRVHDIIPTPVDAGQDRYICLGDSVTLVASAGTKFLWMPGGGTTSSIKVIPQKTTTYSVTVNDGKNCGITSSDEVAVHVYPLPSHAIFENQSLNHCFENGLLTIGPDWGESFYWEPGGEASQYISISQGGEYEIAITDQYSCVFKDQVHVKDKCDPRIFVPDAFSPNGDALHDQLEIFGNYFKNFEIKIFNRWGEIIFISSKRNIQWDGTYRGEEMPVGTYPWIIHYQSIYEDGIENTLKGSITLIR